MKTLSDVLCERDAFQTHGQRTFYLTALRKRGIDVDAFTMDDVFADSPALDKICSELMEASVHEDEKVWFDKATKALETYPLTERILRAVARSSNNPETMVACGMAVRQLCRHYQQRAEKKSWSERPYGLSLVAGLDEIMEGYANLNAPSFALGWASDTSLTGTVAFPIALARLLMCTAVCFAPWGQEIFEWAQDITSDVTEPLSLHIPLVLSELARTFAHDGDTTKREALVARYKELCTVDNEDERSIIVSFFDQRIDGFANLVGVKTFHAQDSPLFYAITRFDPRSWEGADTFYLDALREIGIPLENLSISDQPSPVERELCDAISRATTDAEFTNAIVRALDVAPTSVVVLEYLARVVGSVETGIACGLAVQQIVLKAEASQQLIVSSGLRYVLHGLVLLGEFGRLRILLADVAKRMPSMISTCYRYVLREVTLSSDPEAAVFLTSMANVTPLLLALDPAFSTELVLSKLVHLMINDAKAVEEVDRLLAECLAIPGIQGLATVHFYCDRVQGFEGFFKNAHRSQSTAARGNPMKDLHRLMDRQKFDTIEDVEAFMKSMTGKPIPEIPLEELTDDELVEDLAEEAMNYPPHQQKEVLLRLAADHPTSMAPWLRLVSIAVTGAEMLNAVERGLAAGSRFAEPEYVAENTGHYWGITATRPYMLLLQKKSQALYYLGRLQESIDVCEQILRLNPSDNMGTRVSFTTILLQRGLPEHLKRTNEIFQIYADDTLSVLQWNRLLYLFATKASSETCAQAFKNAMKANRHIPGLLLGKRPAHDPYNNDYILGGVVEAADYADMAQKAWASYPSALRDIRRLMQTITPEA